MLRYAAPAPDADAALETFFIAAVGTVLGIRVYLAATGYPQIGGGTLHIAHVLWGGLLMTAACILLLGFSGRLVVRVASVLGGAGFGTFFDELGKFITRDNDYFYAPAIGLIYAGFVVLYLVIVRIAAIEPQTPEQRLAYALHLAQTRALYGLSAHEAQALLANLDASNAPPDLRAALARFAETPVRQERTAPNLVSRLRDMPVSIYRWLLGQWWFAAAVLGAFVVHSLALLAQALSTVDRLRALPIWGLIAVVLVAVLASGRWPVMRFATSGTALIVAVGIAVMWAQFVQLGLAFNELVILSATTLSAGLVVLGIWRFFRSRLDAYVLFERSLLVSLLVTQVFLFIDHQMLALAGFAAQLVYWVTVRSLLEAERELRAEKPR
jgi:hypothetical protein